MEFGIYQGVDWQAYSGSILGFPGGGPGWPFCGAIKAAEARGEILKIIGVQIVVYGFRTSAGTKIEQIAERCLIFGFGLCTESVQHKFERRGLRKRNPHKFLVRNP